MIAIILSIVFGMAVGGAIMYFWMWAIIGGWRAG